MEFAKYISDFVFIQGYDAQFKTVITGVFPCVDNVEARVKELMRLYPSVQRVSQYQSPDTLGAIAEFRRETVMQ